MTEIKKVAVLGAGLMGSAIAAHVANAGIPCLLLDIVPKGAANRNVIAEGAIEKMLKTKPAPFMSARAAKLITAGNLEDDLGRIADCDWICEAIIERVDLKRDLYARVDKVRKAGSIVSSNTSTIPLHSLTEGANAGFKRDFAVTHFFNPPRYMRLLEVVKGADTRADAIDALEHFGDVMLGKEVVRCKDTPGFIANRIGIYWSYTALSQAFAYDLTVEETDAIVGKPMGIPSTGIFGLADLTGIDLAPHVNDSMLKLLPPSDPFSREYEPSGRLVKIIEKLITEGYTGRKGKGGFYRAKGREVLDLHTLEFRPKGKAELASINAARKGLKALVEFDDKGGKYAWTVLSRTLCYAADLIPEIADDIVSVDRAMKAGYAWKHGPFEQIDQLGTGWFAERLKAEGRVVPKIIEIAAGRPLYKEEGAKALYLTRDGSYAEVAVADDAWTLADKKRGREPIARNMGASLWDVGDGVACLEFHTKMNAIDEDILTMLDRALGLQAEGYKAVIIGNDADNFSVGANVALALMNARSEQWDEIERGIRAGQTVYNRLKFSPMPVVAAVAGMALGGGCEIALHAPAVQACAESYMGLVEVGVGVIPGWGGVKEMLTRHMLNKRRPGGPMPPLATVFEMISTAKVATSAQEAKEALILKPGDGISMNRKRVLADAKKKALAMVAANYQPPKPVEVFLPGPTAAAAVSLILDGFARQGKVLEHDMVVSTALAQVVSGGNTDITVPVSEARLNDLEREAFMSLIRTNATQARIEHMLLKGKPLRN